MIEGDARDEGALLRALVITVTVYKIAPRRYEHLAHRLK